MKKATLYLLILVFFGTMNMISQPFGGRPEKGRGKLEQFKKLKLIEILNLKEDDAIRFFAKLNTHENKMQEVQKRRGDLLDSLELLVKMKSSEKSLEGVFDQLYDCEQQQLMERKSFRTEAKSILSTEQIAKWLLFERKFKQEVRERINETRPERGKRWRDKSE